VRRDLEREAEMSNPLFSLEGRIAVVTGGMGQVGGEIVRGLRENGARVAVLDLEAAEGDGLYRVDVTDGEAVEHAAVQLADTWGVPHILVNAAALDSPPDAPPEEVGPFGGRMAAAGRGSVVNISSIYGMLSPVQDVYDFRRRGGEEFYKPVAYSVSKSALYNMTRYLATYWAKSGVRVNTLTLAGVWNDQPQEFVDAYTSRMPLGRMAGAEEVVGPVVFLASDASSYVTGANLVADGGWSAW
jgi:NAD(P)-dependent dehydrogenase (short-subunit alcohol dehydrogenase family)